MNKEARATLALPSPPSARFSGRPLCALYAEPSPGPARIVKSHSYGVTAMALQTLGLLGSVELYHCESSESQAQVSGMYSAA